MNELENYRLLIFLGGLLAMFFVESLFPRRSWQHSRSLRLFTHSTLALLNTIFLRVLVAAPFLFFAYLIAEKGWGLAPYFGIKGIPEIIATLIVFDGLDYWWHRLNHRIPFLWRFHRVHHNDTHVDVTTSLRFHPGELLISSLVKMTWILLWGPSILAMAVFETAISMASQFHHSNIDFSDSTESTLRSFVVTPRFHASHHSVNPRTGDANFSTILILWDHLFGTFVKPKPEDLKVLGLPHSRDTCLSIAATLKEPFLNHESGSLNSFRNEEEQTSNAVKRGEIGK